MDKRKKKEPKKSKKSISDSRGMSLDAKRNLKFLDIQNCVQIFLSPQTQKFVGCQIGEDITAERPWIYVKKEKIEDTLFLHENSSEFFPIRNMIEDYPETTLLIGSYRTNKEKIEEFLICTTLEAKDDILNLLVVEKKLLLLRVENLINCEARPWSTFGSETEVDGDKNFNNRQLFEILYESKTPELIGLKNEKFTYRLASTKPTDRTCTEILSDARFICKLVYQKRVDAGSQIAPLRINRICQTNLTFPTCKYTQTDHVQESLELTENGQKLLEQMLKEKRKFLENVLMVNYHINLHNTDYEFPNAFIRAYDIETRDLISLQDVINCKDLSIGSVSWNALISGLVAVSYVEKPFKTIINQENNVTHDFAVRKHNDHIVLLWCYTNSLTAKLFMHVNFEITCISYCPHDDNILVGGGASGQIVVWDLTNKLRQVESREILTSSEMYHRNIMRTQTDWFKLPPNCKHVYPIITSNLNVSHKSAVISIEWLPSYNYMTKMGQVENSETKHYQFISCSVEDSVLLAWEIKQCSSSTGKNERGLRKKFGRLSRLPESLMEGVSPLIKYNRRFVPFYKLKLEDPKQANKRIFATDFILSNPKILYEEVNTDVKNHFQDRTFLKHVVPDVPQPHLQSFVVSSIQGYLVNCVWNGQDFDQGQPVNEEICNTNIFLAIHDGPIICCLKNPFSSECFLTVGGSVFGIWVTSSNERPLFWRKGPCRYIAGLWSSTQPISFITIREDNFFEFWDLVDYTVKPIRTFKLKGTPILDVLTDGTKIQARKRTILIADIKGVLKVHGVPNYSPYGQYAKSIEDQMKLTFQIVASIKRRRAALKNWNERLKNNYNFNEMAAANEETKVHVAEQSETSDRRKKQQKEKHTQATEWQKKEELRMNETLLLQKRIDITELKKNTVPLMEKINKHLIQQKKIDIKIAVKDEIFEGNKKFLLDFHMHKRKKISVSFPKQIEEIMKKQYIEDYKLIEKQTLEIIQSGSDLIKIDRPSILGKRTIDDGMSGKIKHYQQKNIRTDSISISTKSDKGLIRFK